MLNETFLDCAYPVNSNKSKDQEMGQRTKKYSLTLAGHRTSVSMEEPFWEALKEISRNKNQSITAIVSLIDRNRDDLPLSSAIRIYVLEYFRENKISQSVG